MSAAVRLDRATTRVAVSVGGRADALLIGLFAFVVGVIGAGRPSLWADEAATISSATRPLGEMRDLLGHVDAVHGLYYLLMHAWFAVVPAIEFWARLPSAMLVGVAAAGVVVLGRQLSTRTVALAAGVVFAVLPRTTWAAIEARSYALSMVDAVWVTVLCVVAVRRDRPWIWAAYAVCLAVATVGNVFVVLVVAAHAVLVTHVDWSRGAGTRWAVAVTAAGLLSAPFLVVMKAQQGQVNWIWPVGPGTLGQFLGDQYFPAVYTDDANAAGVTAGQQVSSDQVTAAAWAWALVAPFLIAALVLAVAAFRRRTRAAEALGPDPRTLVRTAATWVLAPTLVLVVYSMLREPLYQPQYLAFTAPGLALLLGAAVVLVCRSPRRISLVLAVLIVAAVPNYVAQRGSFSKMGRDLSRVADVVAEYSTPGDCLNLDDTAPVIVVEALTSGRPDAFAGLRDYGQTRSAIDRDALFEARAPITAWVDRLPGCGALWTVTARDPALPEHQAGDALPPGARLDDAVAQRVPAAMGFRIVERWQFNLTQVVKSVRPVAGPS